MDDMQSHIERLKKKQQNQQKEIDEVENIKFRRIVKQAKKEREQKEFIQAALIPNLKNNVILWKTANGNLNHIDGYFKNKHIFEIKRGLLSYSLNIVHSGCKEEYIKKHSAMDLFKLQKKANQIIPELIPFLKVS